MSQYKIFRWDGILAKNGINKQPIIYIMPDMDFLEFSKSNSYVLNVEINGTNTLYDGKIVLGSVNTSSFMPNFSACRKISSTVSNFIRLRFTPVSLNSFGMKSL